MSRRKPRSAESENSIAKNPTCVNSRSPSIHGADWRLAAEAIVPKNASSTKLSAPSPKRAYRLLEFSDVYGVSRDRAYDDIRSGDLIARKVGKNTIVLADDAERYIASFPRLELPVQDERPNYAA